MAAWIWRRGWRGEVEKKERYFQTTEELDEMNGGDVLGERVRVGSGVGLTL